MGNSSPVPRISWRWKKEGSLSWNESGPLWDGPDGSALWRDSGRAGLDGVKGEVKKPNPEHPKRPVDGLECAKSEVSGRRLWGLFAEKFPEAHDFFKDHFVANYCPLVFMEESGKNRTPDKLVVSETKPLEELCDQHLQEIVEIFEPDWLVGVGGFAEKRATIALSGMECPR